MATTDVEVEIDGRQLTLATSTRCSTRRGFTKAQVIDYYARIAPVAIPHLAGRALTFRRYPNGTRDAGLLREALPGHRPAWVTWRSDRATARAGSSTAASTSRRRWCGPPTWRRSSSTRRWRWRPTSTRRGRWCSTSIPARRPTSCDCCAIALRCPRRARRGRPRGLVQDVGLEGPADVRAAQHAGSTHEGAGRRSRSPSGSCSRRSSPGG